MRVAVRTTFRLPSSTSVAANFGMSVLLQAKPDRVSSGAFRGKAPGIGADGQASHRYASRQQQRLGGVGEHRGSAVWLQRCRLALANGGTRVGQAMARNPAPIVVPCHRIMGGGGRLVGYSAPGGLETKMRLLEIEGALQTALFGSLPLGRRPQR